MEQPERLSEEVPSLSEAPPSASVASRIVTRDIAVIGASGGGVGALKRLVAELPADHAGVLCVVVHISPESESLLPAILARAGPLPAVQATDGMPLQLGRIHVAPPDCHLLIEHDRLRVVRGPRENRHRPAIDPLFRSAAWSYGPQVVGVVLTGNLDDGTAGLWAVKSCGGTTVVQDPDEAECPEMPQNALIHNRVDHRLRLHEIGPLLARLAKEPVDARAPPPAPIGAEVRAVEFQRDLADGPPPGELSPFTCPGCGGALWEMEDGDILRYRCHTGHGFSQQSLMLDQGIEIERSLYAALRAVEEKAAALRRLAERWPDQIPRLKEDYERRAADLGRSADTLRGLLAGHAPQA